MSDKKVIGILGGMGPLATADLFQKITLHTAAVCDQDHPRVCIDSNTNIADRTAALLHGGTGLLATDGTVQTGIYQRTFEGSGVELLTPDHSEDQAAVMDIIYNGVKAGDLTHDATAFRAACEHLLARGAEVLILGCTELPPAFDIYHLDYPNIDPTLELALAAVRAAGCETK